MSGEGSPTPRQREALQRSLAAALATPVEILAWQPLPASSRAAPWRLDARVADQPRSFVWQVSAADSLEYAALTALADHPLPTPRPWVHDPDGSQLGTPSLVVDFIDGESLLPRLERGEPQAQMIYLEAVAWLQGIEPTELGSLAAKLAARPFAAELAEAHDYFLAQPDPVAEAAYERLLANRPEPPALRFSNGDLWPDNLLFRDNKLAGVIDFESVMFSDPLFEFLNLGFVSPMLRASGLEERYCQLMGFAPALLPWYRVAELYVSWPLLAARDATFMGHSAASLRADLARWLAT